MVANNKMYKKYMYNFKSKISFIIGITPQSILVGGNHNLLLLLVDTKL